MVPFTIQKLMNSITSSLNIVAILTKKLYIRPTHARSHFQWLLACVNRIYCFIDEKIIFDLFFFVRIATLFKHLVIPFIIELYARNDRFKKSIQKYTLHWVLLCSLQFYWIVSLRKLIIEKDAIIDFHLNWKQETYEISANETSSGKVVFQNNRNINIIKKLRLHPANISKIKVNNRNTRKRLEICSKLTIKILERRQWPRSAFWFWCFYC